MSEAIIKQKSKACGLHCIKIKDFSVTIGEDRILDDINLHIHCGCLTTVIGKNGAGKSTLIKSILGEIPHEGKIEFKNLGNETISKLNIGYVPQYLNIAKNTPTSVYDLCASFLFTYPVFLKMKKSIKDKVIKQLKVFEAEHLIDKAVCDLSGGELQRVLLSIAVNPIPNLLILDEPVSGIDHNGMELFYRNIDRLKHNYDMAIILVSHDLDYVKKYSDNVVLLDKRIIKQGKASEVFRSREFNKCFGYMEGGR